MFVSDTFADAVHVLLPVTNESNDAVFNLVPSLNTLIDAIGPPTFATILADKRFPKYNLVEYP